MGSQVNMSVANDVDFLEFRFSSFWWDHPSDMLVFAQISSLFWATSRSNIWDFRRTFSQLHRPKLPTCGEVNE